MGFRKPQNPEKSVSATAISGWVEGVRSQLQLQYGLIGGERFLTL